MNKVSELLTVRIDQMDQKNITCASPLSIIDWKKIVDRACGKVEVTFENYRQSIRQYEEEHIANCPNSQDTEEELTQWKSKLNYDPSQDSKGPVKKAFKALYNEMTKGRLTTLPPVTQQSTKATSTSKQFKPYEDKERKANKAKLRAKINNKKSRRTQRPASEIIDEIGKEAFKKVGEFAKAAANSFEDSAVQFVGDEIREPTFDLEKESKNFKDIKHLSLKPYNKEVDDWLFKEEGCSWTRKGFDQYMERCFYEDAMNDLDSSFDVELKKIRREKIKQQGLPVNNEELFKSRSVHFMYIKDFVETVYKYMLDEYAENQAYSSLLRMDQHFFCLVKDFSEVTRSRGTENYVNLVCSVLGIKAVKYVQFIKSIFEKLKAEKEEELGEKATLDSFEKEFLAKVEKIYCRLNNKTIPVRITECLAARKKRLQAKAAEEKIHLDEIRNTFSPKRMRFESDYSMSMLKMFDILVEKYFNEKNAASSISGEDRLYLIVDFLESMNIAIEEIAANLSFNRYEKIVLSKKRYLEEAKEFFNTNIDEAFKNRADSPDFLISQGLDPKEFVI